MAPRRTTLSLTFAGACTPKPGVPRLTPMARSCAVAAEAADRAAVAAANAMLVVFMIGFPLVVCCCADAEAVFCDRVPGPGESGSTTCPPSPDWRADRGAGPSEWE